MKRLFFIITFLLCIEVFFSVSLTVFAQSPSSALEKEKLSENLLIKLQSCESFEEIEKYINYIDYLYNKNTNFFSYKIKALENFMVEYRDYIIKQSNKLASEKEYKKACELLESKKNLFKDTSKITELINSYSKHFVPDGLVVCKEAPLILNINKLIETKHVENIIDEIKLKNLKENHLTTREFNLLLQSLYAENYRLINLTDYLDFKDDNLEKKEIFLKENEKPLILIFDNLNYTANNPVFVDKYIVDQNQELACYSSKNSEDEQISYNSDLIPILENFIKTFPSFSYKNARAILNFTSENGILGYNINKQNPNFNIELNSLKNLCTALKQKGYFFSYENINFNELINNELELEKQFITSLKQIIMPLNIFSFNKKQVKYDSVIKLKEYNFKVFLSSYYGENVLFKDNHIILGYKKIDGKYLKNSEDYNFKNIIDFTFRNM